MTETPLLLFAATEVTQESLGFSPAELLFGHTVRGPLKLLKEKWLENPLSSTNLLCVISSLNLAGHVNWPNKTWGSPGKNEELVC